MYVLELAGQHDAFALAETRAAASAPTLCAPGLATARGISEHFENLAFAHRASELVGRGDPTVEDAVAVLSAATIERTGTVAVRAVDVRSTAGVDTQAAERALGDALVDRGFEVDLDDPDHELRALFAAGEVGSTCALGWLAAETDRTFGQRQPGDRPFFQPGSMDPLLARALVNLAGAREETTVLDPMCGTGGLLIEAGLVGARVLGVDAQEKMVTGSRENLADALAGDWGVVHGDASALPIGTDALDAVVFDTPYGRQSKIEGELDSLVESALAEARRVADRCVVVGDRAWTDAAEAAGWTVSAQFERRVHRSLTRYILVLEDRD